MGIDTALLRLSFSALIGGAGMASACDGNGSDEKPSPTADAKTPTKSDKTKAKSDEGPAPTLLRLKDKNGARGFACEQRSSKKPIRCGVVVKLNAWHLAGPIGTRIKIDDQEYVLGQEHVLDKKSARALSKSKLGAISSAEAHLELPYPGPTFVGGEFSGLCSKGDSDNPGHQFRLEVRIPSVQAPLQTVERLNYDAKDVDSVITESTSLAS